MLNYRLETGSNRDDIDKIVLCVFDESDERLYRSMAAQYFPRHKDLPAPIPAVASVSPKGKAESKATSSSSSLKSKGTLLAGSSPAAAGKGPAPPTDCSPFFCSWNDDSSGSFLSSAAEDVHCRVSALLNSRVALFTGDITSLPVSVLVYTTNKSFVDRGAISQYNAQHAAPEYHQERKKELTKPGIFGEVRCTSGGALSCKYLYHVAGQEFSAAQAQRCRSKLCEIYSNCLTQAAAQGDVKTVCFTPLLVDVFGFPPALACEIAVTAVREW